MEKAVKPAVNRGAGDPAEGERSAVMGSSAGSRGHGQRDYSHLPTHEEIHDVPEAQRVCPRCGANYAPSENSPASSSTGRCR